MTVPPPDDFIIWPYRYARELTASSNIIANPQYKKLVDNVRSVAIVVAGIPDGLSLLHMSKIKPTMITRLNVFAQEALSEKFLQSVDESYGEDAYPLMRLISPVASNITAAGQVSLPPENFYAITNKIRPPEAKDQTAIYGGEFVEYRYLQQRQFYPTLAWDQSTGNTYRFAMPEKHKSITCLIMPENFTRTAVDRGYWDFNGLVFLVFAKNCTLVGGRFGDDSNVITSISSEDPRALSIVTNFLSKIGMHKIESTAINQIYAVDKYLTVVVGSLNNLAL